MCGPQAIGDVALMTSTIASAICIQTNMICGIHTHTYTHIHKHRAAIDCNIASTVFAYMYTYMLSRYCNGCCVGVAYTPLVEAGNLLRHLGVGSGSSYFPLLGYLVEGIHVGLVSGHLLLKSL